MNGTTIQGRRRRIAALFGLLSLWAPVICAASPPESPESLVLSGGDGTRFFVVAVQPGDRFAIVFTHSLALSKVEEWFEALPGGRFRLVETRYADFGAGLPYEETPDQKMRFEDGQIIRGGYSLEFNQLWLRVGHIADHRLVTPAGEIIHLNTLAKPGTAVRVCIETEESGFQKIPEAGGTGEKQDE